MQSIKWQGIINLKHLINVVLLTGLSTISIQSTSAQTAPTTQTYSLWCTSARPINSQPDPETSPVEVGVRFSSRVAGEITAIRFYRITPIDSGYSAHLWDEAGNLMASVSVIEGQSPTPGWQTAQIYPPVEIEAGKIYTASYYAKTGGYAVDLEFFKNFGVANGPLMAPRDTETFNNGVYAYTTVENGFAGTHPTQSYNGTNYWVDVVFRPKVAY